MKITVNEQISWANCIKISNGKYDCIIEQNNLPSWWINLHSTIGIIWLINSGLLIITLYLVIFLFMYRIFVKYSNYILNKESWKKLFKFIFIVFITSLLIYLLWFIWQIIAPWIYK